MLIPCVQVYLWSTTGCFGLGGRGGGQSFACGKEGIFFAGISIAFCLFLPLAKLLFEEDYDALPFFQKRFLEGFFIVVSFAFAWFIWAVAVPKGS